MKERAAPEGSLTQVSAVTGFGLEIQMCHGWFEDDVQRARGEKKERKRKSSHDKAPCQETSRGNNQHVN